MLYLLAGDYEESGRIDLNAPGNYYGLCAVKQDGLYYAFDPFEIRGDRWIAFSDMSFADADVQKLADTLREKCDYSPFTEGVYEVNTFTLPDKETWALEKVFKQREYTDEEIQQLGQRRTDAGGGRRQAALYRGRRAVSAGQRLPRRQ